jgi:hypothetical protein
MAAKILVICESVGAAKAYSYSASGGPGMKSHRGMTAILMVLAATGASGKDKKQSLPPVIGQARYVYVEAVNGREFDRNLDAADREAIADVRDALRADLVFVVRKGRMADENGRGGSGQLPQQGAAGAPLPGQPHGAGPVAGGDGMDADFQEDLLEVRQMKANGKLSGPLWQRSMPDGLTAPRMGLVRQFEEAVEKAYPPQPANQPANPTSNPQ